MFPALSRPNYQLVAHSYFAYRAHPRYPPLDSWHAGPSEAATQPVVAGALTGTRYRGSPSDLTTAGNPLHLGPAGQRLLHQPRHNSRGRDWRRPRGTSRMTTHANSGHCRVGPGKRTRWWVGPEVWGVALLLSTRMAGGHCNLHRGIREARTQLAHAPPLRAYKVGTLPAVAVLRQQNPSHQPWAPPSSELKWNVKKPPHRSRIRWRFDARVGLISSLWGRVRGGDSQGDWRPSEYL
jgi:hypothetical protein